MADAEYVVDTSSWIALSRTHPIDDHERTWAGIDDLAASGRVRSPRGVYDEISAGKDRLWEWVDARQEIIFAEPTLDLLMLVAEINDRFPGLADRNKAVLDADPYVVALAALPRRQQKLSGNGPAAVVTEEADRPDKPTKIPFVARSYGVSCTNMAGLLEREGLGR